MGVLGEQEEDGDGEVEEVREHPTYHYKGEPIQLSSGVIAPPRFLRTNMSVEILWRKQSNETVDLVPVKVTPIPLFYRNDSYG